MILEIEVLEFKFSMLLMLALLQFVPMPWTYDLSNENRLEYKYSIHTLFSHSIYDNELFKFEWVKKNSVDMCLYFLKPNKLVLGVYTKYVVTYVKNIVLYFNYH